MYNLTVYLPCAALALIEAGRFPLNSPLLHFTPDRPKTPTLFLRVIARSRRCRASQLLTDAPTLAVYLAMHPSPHTGRPGVAPRQEIVRNDPSI
jgi:hypothetical protein